MILAPAQRTLLGLEADFDPDDLLGCAAVDLADVEFVGAVVDGIQRTREANGASGATAKSLQIRGIFRRAQLTIVERCHEACLGKAVAPG